MRILCLPSFLGYYETFHSKANKAVNSRPRLYSLHTYIMRLISQQRVDLKAFSSFPSRLWILKLKLVKKVNFYSTYDFIEDIKVLLCK